MTACQRNVQRGTIYYVLARAAPGPHAAAALARHVSKYREFRAQVKSRPNWSTSVSR